MLSVLAAAAAVVSAALPTSAAVYPRITRVADGVFTYEQVDPTKRGVTVHNLIVIGSEGVLIADGQGTSENTARLVRDVNGLTTLPIKYVVVGSVHGDHRGGDAAFPATAAFVRAERSIGLGGRVVEVKSLGRAHTGSDLLVYLPREKILYTSEAFSNGIFPSLANGYPSEWVRVLERAEQMDADIYVPAHALVGSEKLMTGKDDVRRYRAALTRVISEGRRLHDAQVPVEAAAAAADFGEFGSWARVAENAPAALTRVYMEIEGRLP
jgi:glyoxylase-like metal-dependent hydrolase (beta-lactamase superfamily II)